MSEITRNLIDQVLTDCQSELSQIGVTLGRNLGCGDYGCAYAVGSDKVLKITTHKKEADAARWLSNQDSPPNNYPKIELITARNCENRVCAREKLKEFPRTYCFPAG